MSRAPLYELRGYGGGEPAPALDLARLHAQLLGHSPVPRLGPDFASGFYYSVLPAQDHNFGAVAYVDGFPAGFVCATASSGDFLIKAARQNLFRVAYLVAKSVGRKPARIRDIAATLYRMYKRANMPQAESEILSLGVLPEYGGRFARQTGIRISNDLIDLAVEGCRRRGARSVRVSVDGRNLPAQLLYSSLGWNLEDTNVFDTSGDIVEFSLPLRHAA